MSVVFWLTVYAVVGSVAAVERRVGRWRNAELVHDEEGWHS